MSTKGSTVYKPVAKLERLARILRELDELQSEFDRRNGEVAEDMRWSRIYLSKAMSSLNTSIHDARKL